MQRPARGICSLLVCEVGRADMQSSVLGEGMVESNNKVRRTNYGVLVVPYGGPEVVVPS